MANTINVLSTTDSVQFLHRARAYLNRNEAENNTILSIAGQAGSDLSMLLPPFWFSLVETEEGDSGAAVYALPDGLVLSEMDRSLVIPIVSSLLSAGVLPERIFAPPSLAEIATAHLAQLTGRTYMLKEHWVSLVSSKLVPPPPSELGHLRLATLADEHLVGDLGRAYGLERPSIVDVSEYFLLKLRTQDLYLWVCDRTGSITTAIATSGATDTVIRIAAVFTPKAHRCKGYAGAALSTLTNAMLDAHYKSVTLTVQNSDPNLIHMYKSLGYTHSHDSLEFVLNATEN
jgi:hypothetical protein